ncbi:MAG: 3'-5' exonuclease [Chloroflexota bacterium]
MNLREPSNLFGGQPPRRWVAIDFETTGIWSRDPSTGVIEVAVVIYERGDEVDRWSTLVDPEVQVSDFIVNLTGITSEAIDATGVNRGVARHELQERLKDADWVIAHNMDFDRHGLAWLGVHVPEANRFCTMVNLVPDSEKWPRLSEALAHFGLEQIGTPHRAETDARSAGRIFLEMVRRGW